MVALWMVTYNHGDFIENAIESVMMQKSTFKYKLFIGEDNSTDKTREICKKLKEKYADIIELILHKKNIGANANGIYMYQKCFESGAKYIALCEGDDYWTDEYKLQKQVNILEANPKLSFCYHGVEVKNEIQGVIFEYSSPNKYITQFKDVLLTNSHFIPTCSLMFRMAFLPNPLPNWIAASKIGDIPLELMLLDRGDAFFIYEKMACYRRHSSSLTSNKEHLKAGRDAYFFVYTNLNKHFNYKYWYLFYYKIILNRLGYIKDFFKK